MARQSQLSTFALAAVLAAGLGCKTPFQKKLTLTKDIAISAVAVYPFAFRWQEPAYRSYELSQRLLAQVDGKAGDQVLLFGPSEHRVFRTDEVGWPGPAVSGLLAHHGLRPERVMVLKPWAEKRVTASDKELVDAKGDKVGAAQSQETTYVGHVELVQPFTRATLVEISGEARVDPFSATGDDADPSPELTRLMELLVGEALDAVEMHFSQPTPPRNLGVKFAIVPWEILQYAEEGRPALELLLRQMDVLEADLVRLNRVRFANPEMTDDEAARLAKLPGGLYVLSADTDAKLRKGETITAVNSGPALLQSLQRARFSQDPIRLRVQTENGSVEERHLF